MRSPRLLLRHQFPGDDYAVALAAALPAFDTALDARAVTVLTRNGHFIVHWKSFQSGCRPKRA